MICVQFRLILIFFCYMIYSFLLYGGGADVADVADVADDRLKGSHRGFEVCSVLR